MLYFIRKYISDISIHITDIGTLNKEQLSSALTLQAYAISTLEQPDVDFGKTQELLVYQKRINKSLIALRAHAAIYLYFLQPTITCNMNNINNYRNLYSVLPSTLPLDSSVEKWSQELQAVLTELEKYKSAAQKICVELQIFHDSLVTNAKAFQNAVTDLNIVVSGNNEVLESIEGKLNKIQANIDSSIRKITISGLGILGRKLFICVGPITNFITAGTITSAVMGGIGVVMTGPVAELDSITALVNGNKEKAQLLAEEHPLEPEVKLALAISSCSSSLEKQVGDAIIAASAMVDSWNNIASDFRKIILDLQSGVLSTAQTRQLFITIANGDIDILFENIQTTKEQISNTGTKIASPGQTVNDVIMCISRDLI
ncbi:HBL/NHE enterotoxin family protein [Salmonella enterica subsp. enterica serovar Typhimurium]|nr:hypothetical protein [Salmonella enterica subsp. enterica serovar Typhimurium]ECN4746393.1 HBL/NHE enterotoxin family protein [Salmonella enterica subsp. enterica serovar Typhimurium]EDZ4439987.1 HBL/NHE enterotoxin family protein [Salmonella enterica subsp. enterica serovar Typhimurium]EEB8891886.1 HBL/NHE enterotoxin family protein [Salmonella enterica subsp. enterica serovar Typhimurium]